MKITIPIIAIAAVVVAVIFVIRSVGEDVEEARSGFAANQTAPAGVPKNQVSVFDEEEWGRPSYSQRPPEVPEEVSFETDYCWLTFVNKESTQFWCRGLVEVSLEGDVVIKCEGYANKEQSRRRGPLVDAERTITIDDFLSKYWELGKTFPADREVEAGRCGVFEWPS